VAVAVLQKDTAVVPVRAKVRSKPPTARQAGGVVFPPHTAAASPLTTQLQRELQQQCQQIQQRFQQQVQQFRLQVQPLQQTAGPISAASIDPSRKTAVV